jgi:hypothetical protein
MATQVPLLSVARGCQLADEGAAPPADQVVPLLVEYIVAVPPKAVIATQVPLLSVAREIQSADEGAAPPADQLVPLLVEYIVAVLP